jgi:hypothetical protein
MQGESQCLRKERIKTWYNPGAISLTTIWSQPDMRLAQRLMILITLLAFTFSTALATEETTPTEESEAVATDEAAVVDDGDIEGEGSLGGENNVGVEAQTAADSESAGETEPPQGSGTLELLMLILGISAVAGVGYSLYQREENSPAA